MVEITCTLVETMQNDHLELVKHLQIAPEQSYGISMTFHKYHHTGKVKHYTMCYNDLNDQLNIKEC